MAGLLAMGQRTMEAQEQHAMAVRGRVTWPEPLPVTTFMEISTTSTAQFPGRPAFLIFCLFPCISPAVLRGGDLYPFLQLGPTFPGDPARVDTASATRLAPVISTSWAAPMEAQADRCTSMPGPATSGQTHTPQSDHDAAAQTGMVHLQSSRLQCSRIPKPVRPGVPMGRET